MKNTKKGISTVLSIVTGVAVVVIVVGGYYIYTFTANTPATPANQQGQNTNTTTSTATTNPNTTTPLASNLKTYSNTKLGFSFTYPKDFFLKSEQFSKDGVWKASFHADRGDINITIASGIITSGEVRLQSATIKMGKKDAMYYNTRRDVCDVVVARAGFDSDNSIEFSFSSCGSELGALFDDKQDISNTLSSVVFSNENTRLTTLPTLGFGFRYPIQWDRPSEYPHEETSGSQLTFGNSLQVVTGNEYSTTLKRKRTVDEIVKENSTASTTDQLIDVGGKQAHLLTLTPVSGSKQRTAYIANKTSTDLIIISQRAVDSEGLDLVLSSFFFLPNK